MSREWRPPPPVDDSVYRGLAGEFVDLVSPHSECDPVALLGQFLVAFGSVIGRTAHFMVEGCPQYLNFFLALVGPSSAGRKGTSWNHVKRCFQAVSPDWAERRILGGIGSGEGILQELRDLPSPAVGVGVGERANGPASPSTASTPSPATADRRLLVLEEELGAALHVAGNSANSLSAVLRNAWDGDDLTKVTRRGTLRATAPHVSVIGHVTPEELREVTREVMVRNGLLGRFAWLAVGRSKLLPSGGRLHEVDFTPFHRKLAAAVDFARRAGTLARDEGAEAEWGHNYAELTDERRGDALGPLAGKLAPMAMRLACVYALLDRSAVVRAGDLMAALHLLQYAVASARAAFGASELQKAAHRIMAGLARSEGEQGLSRTEIRDLFGRNLNAARIEEILEELREQGYAGSMQMPARKSFNQVEYWFTTMRGLQRLAEGGDVVATQKLAELREYQAIRNAAAEAKTSAAERQPSASVAGAAASSAT